MRRKGSLDQLTFPADAAGLVSVVSPSGCKGACEEEQQDHEGKGAAHGSEKLSLRRETCRAVVAGQTLSSADSVTTKDHESWSWGQGVRETAWRRCDDDVVVVVDGAATKQQSSQLRSIDRALASAYSRRTQSGVGRRGREKASRTRISEKRSAGNLA